MRCAASPMYFIYNYCYIFSHAEKKWIRFKLWPKQVEAIRAIHKHRKVVVIKRRRFGFSWLVRCYFLWAAIFEPIAQVGMWSKSLDDAILLLGEEEGMKGTYRRLPAWLKPGDLEADNTQLVTLANGSTIRSRPYTQAESFGLTHCLIDEIDRISGENDRVLVNNLEPALKDAEKVVYGSISDKTRPNSILKNTYKSARAGENDFYPLFMDWYSVPGCDDQLYQEEWDKKYSQLRDKAETEDWMMQQYPRTDDEALAPAQANKRVPFSHIERVFKMMDPEDAPNAPALYGLSIFKDPEKGHNYVIGADPAEGIAGGDDSSADVVDEETGEQVATLRGYLEPKKQFPGALFELAKYYSDANILVERNNHGHAVIGELQDLIAGEEGCEVEVLKYPGDGREGWLSSVRGKVILYDACAQLVRDGDALIHSKITRDQLADIEIATLRASEGNRDDAADSFALAQVARSIQPALIEGDVFF